MLIEYLSIKEEYDKLIFISNILHDIKYSEDTNKLYAKYSEIDLSVIKNLNNSEFTEFCVLTTFIEQAFNNKDLPGPSWVYDKRLFLTDPFFSDKSPDLVLHATQACLNHNVFMARNNFEVY